MTNLQHDFGELTLEKKGLDLTMWSPGPARTQVLKAQHHFPAFREEGLGELVRRNSTEGSSEFESEGSGVSAKRLKLREQQDNESSCLLGKFSRLQQREGKKSTPPQPGLGEPPAEFSLSRAEEMPEEELLDVQKMLSFGQEKSRSWQEICFGMKELRGRTAERGLQEPGERSCTLGVSQAGQGAQP
ncbi:hypothetical protein DV515_00017579 [Chloebia gouldiae]|uniref:Uncharacterized protein n=1 Tax=Chloebia gouldiae TaxID=44316 RepID=A0A3L8Q9W4_CHLGU|nr:hypothetical protein DV515_00017579 [Chloebia gouldiae]